MILAMRECKNVSYALKLAPAFSTVLEIYINVARMI